MYVYIYARNGEDIKMYYARMGEIGYTCLQMLLYIDSNILSNNFRVLIGRSLLRCLIKIIIIVIRVEFSKNL